MNRFRSWLSILLLTGSAVIGCCILGASLLCWYWEYETFTTFILEAVEKQDWRSYFEQSVFPATRYQQVRYLGLTLFLLWCGSFYWLWRNIAVVADKIYAVVNEIKSQIQQQVQQTTPQEKIVLGLLLLVFALRGLWQMHRYELQYDEAWTYNHFVSKGFLIAAISPNNNHIFYTLLACISDSLPLAAKYSLRLPVYLGGLLTCLLFYGFARNRWGTAWALVSLAWFAFSPSIVFYSMYARGYIFQILATVLAIWTTLKVMETKHKQGFYWLLWGLANGLGMYSVPTHAYVWLLLNIVLLLAKFQQAAFAWKTWCWTNVILGIVLMLCYLPLLVTNGADLLLGAAAQSSAGGEYWWNYQDKVSDWLLLGGGRHTPVYWFVCVLIAALMLLGWKSFKDKKRRNELLIAILFLSFPTVLNFTLGTQPPYRVWCFLVVSIAMCIPIIGAKLLPKQPSLVLGCLAISLSLFGFWRTEVHYFINWSKQLDKDAVVVSQRLLEQNIDECYFFSNYDKPLLECYHLRAGRRLKTAMIDAVSKNYAPFIDGRIYQAVLWDKEDRISTAAEQAWLKKHYPALIYENSRIQIYASALVKS